MLMLLEGSPPKPRRAPWQRNKAITDVKLAIHKKNRKPFPVVIWLGSPHEPCSGPETNPALCDNLPNSHRERTVALTSHETSQQVRHPLRDPLHERHAEITAMDRAIVSLGQRG